MWAWFWREDGGTSGPLEEKGGRSQWSWGREGQRNPLNSFELLSEYVVYSISFGEKYYYAERFRPFQISTRVAHGRETTRRKRALLSPALMSFLRVCSFPCGYFFYFFRKTVLSWKTKKKITKTSSVLPWLGKKTKPMNSQCFFSWHLWVWELQKSPQWSVFYRWLCVHQCTLTDAGFRYRQALSGALLWQRRGHETTVRIVISYVAHGCLCPAKQTEIIRVIVALMRMCSCSCMCVCVHAAYIFKTVDCDCMQAGDNANVDLFLSAAEPPGVSSLSWEVSEMDWDRVGPRANASFLIFVSPPACVHPWRDTTLMIPSLRRRVTAQHIQPIVEICAVIYLND